MSQGLSGRWTTVVALSLIVGCGPDRENAGDVGQSAAAPPTRAGTPQRPALGALSAPSEEAGRSDTRSTCEDVFRNWKDASAEGPFKNAPVLTGAAVPDPAAVLRAATRPVVIRDVDLSGRSFRDVKLSNVCFENTDLSRTDWRGAVVDRVAFVRSNLKGADIRARFPGSTFVSSVLDQANAEGADLTGASIVGGTFSGLNLRRATLRKFELDCSANLLVYGDHCTDSAFGASEGRKIEPVDAREADLTDARFANWAGDWRLEGARVNRTGVWIDNAPHLTGVRFEGPVLVQAAYGVDTVQLNAGDWTKLAAAWREDLADAAEGPSFSCQRAGTAVERMICDPEDYGALADLDRRTDREYRAALDLKLSTAAEQMRWLKERNGCRDAECVRASYERRLEALRRKLGPVSLPAPGQERLYADRELPVTPEFRETELYRRLIPAMLSGPGNVLYMRGLPDGSVEAIGDGYTFNAHICGVMGGPFQLDQKTGWLMGRRDPADVEPGQPAELPALRVLPDVVEFENESREFVGGGARCGWSEMAPVPAPASVIAAVRASMTEDESS